MQTTANLDTVANALWEARENHIQISPLSDHYNLHDISQAYKIQQINTAKFLKMGEVIVGKKIGLTSFAVQKQLGVDQPDYGMLFGSTKVENYGSIKREIFLQPKVEAEIALVLKKDLSGDISMEDLLDAVDYAVASIEIVDSRITDWKITITDTIADNASASHFVLGSQKVSLADIDLMNGKMQLLKNDEIVSEGSGAACMGNPMNAALWLAKTMIQLGEPLRQGEILLTGALGPMVPVEAGDHITATIDGLGTVEVTFI